MFNRLGLESLTQRGKSDLFKDLETVFQYSQDALKDVNPAEDSQDCIKLLNKANVPDKLLSVLKHYTKMPIQKVIIKDDLEVNLMCVWRTNRPYYNKNRVKKTDGMMTEEINRMYNDKTGSFSHQIDPSTSLYQFGVVINYGLWFYKNDQGGFLFTPAEFTAVLLHEIGHVDNIVRTFNRVQNRLVDASEIVTYVNTAPDKDVIMTLIKHIKESPYLDASWAPIIKSVETYFRTSNQMDDPYYFEALTALTCAMSAELASNNLNDFLYLESDATSKVRTYVHDVDIERSADEFSSRHGAYAPLVSFFVKADAAFGPKVRSVFKQTMNQEAPIIMSLLLDFQYIFRMSAEEVSSGYDPLLRRLELIVETGKHAFHDSNLPPDMVSDISNQIKNAEAYIQSYKSFDHRKMRMLIKTWKDNVGKFGRLVKAPFHNRLAQDYGKLQDANRSLSRHNLYYLANQ